MRDLYPFLKLYRQYWRKIALGILLAILTLLASICLLSISGWFLASTALAGIMGVTFNYLLPSAGVRGSAVMRTVFRYGERLVSHDTTFRILAKLRVFTFRNLLPLTPTAISRFKQAELLNRLVADIDTLDHLYLHLISPIVSAIMVIFMVTVGLLFIDIYLALTLGVILTVLVLITPIIFYYAGNPIGISLTQLKGQYRTELTAWLQGQAELAIFNALARFRTQLNNTETKWLNTQKKQASLTGLSQSFIILTSGLTTVLILWLAASGVGVNHTLNPLIALFAFASLASFEAIAPVATAFLHLSQVTSSAKRVNELLSQQPDVTFIQAKADYLPQANLQLDNISFSYPEQPQQVLSNISLQLQTGQHVALLGKTGCGKSTLLQLLTRAWDPQQGQIILNQIALPDYDEQTIRQMISVVTQRVYIFSATLRHNLLMANANATNQQLTEVLNQVGLNNLLEGVGLNQWLGEGGRQLSGGEQTRIGIARALLHQAPLILLDEPTNGLDADTEQQILHILKQHAKNKTLIMVTHRLTNLNEMDRIVVMDGGKIIEQGNHQTLLEQKGRYWQFVKNANQ
ncbi:heme ABC transporter ATP-binding protein/permease CydC [Entomomonas asaccharolytica]|uniref:Glutathione/L-cysteine transport system ATP-binding/permease protein CydC n=1 Tax=Entomomonas asaccharolytica TaxID=2785331 RepID=A0A974RXP5_9GAMM|nr:cysteine/glutathione ABC transporter ATP-binding protein/permease CydC [Entomomonas asaccharolytica]QQP86481.1 cysteine/glutathione ABC transporter ATP-binding protein/permease CydC [Entomomonas asaccharolytica]